jgi:hypothetical protein
VAIGAVLVIGVIAGAVAGSGGKTVKPVAASATAKTVKTAAPARAHTPVAKAPARKAAAPARTTAVPVQTTTAPPQTTAAAAAAPPAAPASCRPLTNAGNCYEPGEYCRNADHGTSGVAGDGDAITCEDNDGWRWEAT